MSIRRVHPSIADSAALPSIVQLDDNLFGAAFVLMKLLPARFMLERARASGQLRPGSMVVETTSGTFGLGLAMLCRLRGYRLTLVSDPAIDAPFQRRLEDLGAVVDIVRTPRAVGGFQRARLERLAELRALHHDHYWPGQYDNPHNPGAYAPVAELLTETIGEIDVLVGTVGSGGSMCGTSSYLRTLFPGLVTVGVDTFGSVLFGQRDAPRKLRGLGNSLMPPNVDHRAFDEVHWMSAAEGFAATRELHREHAMFMGPTSGAAYRVARWWARRRRDAKIVVLFPDEGYRYQDTVYSDAWLHAQGLWRSAPLVEPREVQHPGELGDGWARFAWNRRSYEQVTGHPFQEDLGHAGIARAG